MTRPPSRAGVSAIEHGLGPRQAARPAYPSGLFSSLNTGRTREPSADDLREELERLEREALLSAQRRNLHDRIDFGYATDEPTKAREREVSDERRELHERINLLRELLESAEPGPTTARRW